MVIIPKSKRDLLNNIRQLVGKGNTYFFRAGTRMPLYLWGEKVPHMLNDLLVREDGKIRICTWVSGKTEFDDLSRFTWSEIRDIFCIIRDNITTQKFFPDSKMWV